MADAGGESLEVWSALSERLAAYFRRRCRDEESVQDLLQETYARIHDGLADLRDESRVVPWVFRIARNVLTDQLRRRTHAELPPGEPPARAPDESNLNATVEGWLHDFLPALPAPYREALVLAELEQLPQDEVGRRLGLSHSGAKSRVQRGRRMLRELLERCCHLEFDRRGNVVDYRERGDCTGC